MVSGHNGVFDEQLRRCKSTELLQDERQDQA